MLLNFILKPTFNIGSDVMHEVWGNSISWYLPYGKKKKSTSCSYPCLKLAELFFIVNHLAGH